MAFGTLKNVPGPWYTSLNSLWYYSHLMKGNQLQAIAALHKQYGPVVRIASNVVSIGDVDAVRAIHATHKTVKGPIYDGFHFSGADNIFATRDVQFYKERKRLVAPVFTVGSMAEMEPFIMSAGVNSLIQRLDQHAELGDEINLLKIFSFMTLDVMGEIAFGNSFGLLKETDHKIIDWMQDMLMLGVYKTALGESAAQFMFPREVEAEKNVVEFAREAIRRRRESGLSRPDSLQKLLDAEDPETGARLSDDAVITETIVQLSAGTDTTSTALTWAIHRLLDRPETMKCLQIELDQAFPSINDPISNAAVRNLPYLNAVINETLRVHPVGAGDAQRVVPEGGMTICGHYIPGGTIIIPQQFVLHHLESHWEDPYAFKPERWFADQQKLKEMQRAYMPFSMGARACLGRHLAWLELRTTLAAVVRRYDLKRIPGADMTMQHRLIVRPAGNALNVTLTKRQA